MTNVKVYSRSNVSGNPYLWRPVTNMQKKEVPQEALYKQTAALCDNVNDFLTTYVAKRIWIAQSGIWQAPLYVVCFYVE